MNCPPEPTLSVVITTFGRTEKLRRCLESVKTQRVILGDQVWVVMDGPQPDDMLLVESMAEEFPHFWRMEAPKGRAEWFGLESRNHLLNQAAQNEIRLGDFLVWQDDDDRFAPGAFDRIRAAAVRHPGRLLMFRCRFPWGGLIWRDKEKQIAGGKVCGACFVPPVAAIGAARCGHHHGGDYEFIRKVVDANGGDAAVEWVDEVITEHGPFAWGRKA